jgi:ATP-dependent HslUV protease ATP-binding subunit HslU
MINALTPSQIVAELNKFIIGQTEAKEAIANAVRYRARREALTDEKLKAEIMPKNILMVGPTGVGKTEISRRLASLANSPFVKVEATKFTEVGYVGRDVDSIIRDLVEIAIKIEKENHLNNVKDKARENAINKVLDIIVGSSAGAETRNKFKKKILSGELDNKEIEVQINESRPQNTPIDISGNGASMGVINLSDMIGKAMNSGSKKKQVKLKISEAIESLTQDESEEMSDEDMLIRNALKATENNGIVFIDEIDKIIVRQSSGKEVSREGVQRDLLPLLEGTTVQTKYGTIKTDHVLFICSGAFHLAKPSDLLPELQGRLPIRVELDPLTEEDLLRILKEPFASLPVQYKELLKTEGLELDFTEQGLKKIASLSAEINRKIENIGARRLHTIIERILADVSFNADSMKKKKIKIDEKFILDNLKNISLSSDQDLSKFIL